MASYLKEKGITGASVDKYRFDLKEPIYDATGVPRPGSAAPDYIAGRSRPPSMS